MKYKFQMHLQDTLQQIYCLPNGKVQQNINKLDLLRAQYEKKETSVLQYL